MRSPGGVGVFRWRWRELRRVPRSAENVSVASDFVHARNEMTDGISEEGNGRRRGSWNDCWKLLLSEFDL